MKEAILHYVWQYKLFNPQQLQTTTGATVEVIDVGMPNKDAGPDFFNAKLKIDDTLWAGNVEMHLKSSDWQHHQHQHDKAYDNVILHVVAEADEEVKRTNGELIPQLELVVPEYVKRNYEHLQNEERWIPCEDKIQDVPQILIDSFKNRLLIERLEQKTESVEELLTMTNNHWEEAFYILLARSYGFGINTQPFERVARLTPLSVLAKHKDNLFQLEAVLFGQAGFLDEEAKDDYQASLAKEYQFLKKKFNLSSIQSTEWKMLRLRPDNFPYVRIAQFAALIHASSKMFSKIIHATDVADFRKLFDTEVSQYWHSHYLFGKESKKTKKKLGKSSVDSLIINTIIPFLFTYAKKNNEPVDGVLTLLEKMPTEKNSIISSWKALSLTADSAYDTQALLQLKKCYCDNKKCLHCSIGHKVLTVN